MKTFLKQYFSLWLSFFVLVPCAIVGNLCQLLVKVMYLVAYAILGCAIDYDDIYHDLLPS